MYSTLSISHFARQGIANSTPRFASAFHPCSAALAACEQHCRQYSLRRIESPARHWITEPLGLKDISSKDTLIGRTDNLSKLWSSLRPSPTAKGQAQRVVVLHGPDGVGKTHLATHFSKLHAESFSSVWWVNGKDRNTLNASLAALASRLPQDEIISTLLPGKPAAGGNDAVELQASMVLKWLARANNTKWLLILDNVGEDHGLDGESMHQTRTSYNLRDFFPKAAHGSVIIITPQFPPPFELGEAHSVERLHSEKALQFFDHALPFESPASGREVQSAKMLVRHLEDIPLGLTLAASYIRQTGLSISSYLQLYLETNRQIMQAPTQVESRDTMTNSTISLTFNEIQQSHALAARLLLVLARYNHTNIPSKLPRFVSDISGPSQGRTNSDVHNARHIAKALQSLRDLSLITVNENPESYSIHPIVQTWCRTGIPLDSKERSQLNTLALLTLSKAATEALSTTIGSRLTQQSLLPHTDSILRLLQTSPDTIPSTSANLEAIKSLGALYTSQGRLKDAESMYLQAISRSQIMYGHCNKSTRELAKTLKYLRFRQSGLGEYDNLYWWVSALSLALEMVIGIFMILVAGFVGLLSVLAALI
ncbi:P-loop containing nucleoside triphosphate hydrolase protein, partial [Aspergillus spectabilis]